jgi:hypothetical protein
MPILSLRLPDDVDAWLGREAVTAERPKSEIARDAIVEYLRRVERDRFLGAIARAARSTGGEDPLAIAAEALPLDNEALGLTEARSVHEPRGAYRARRKRRS